MARGAAVAESAAVAKGTTVTTGAATAKETQSEEPPALTLSRIRVGHGRIRAQLELAPKTARFTSPELIQRVLKHYPFLPQHACVNESGATFGSVMNYTPLPHLLEHLVISEQARMSLEDETVFVGTSEWLDEERGIAYIQVNFTDDLIALRAFREATSFLNQCVIG